MSDGVSRTDPDVRLATLRGAVQHNCNIADAHSTSRYSMCVYLMKMREYYRWAQGLAFTASLPNEAVGQWLAEREAELEDLEAEPFAPVVIGAEDFDPFDDVGINAALDRDGLVYSGGYGSGALAHFFLGERESTEQRDGYTVHTVGREYARDLTSPPAMTRDEVIYIRRESLQRMLWERLEVWRWSRPDSALGRAFAFYDFDDDFDESLERLTRSELDTLRRHEIGEVRAGRLLGEFWPELLCSLPRSRAEIMLRAVRDHLADCLETLPALIDADDAARLHFWFGGLTGMRKEIFPALWRGYEAWREGGGIRSLRDTVGRGREHWLDIGIRCVELYRDDPAAVDAGIVATIEASRL